MSRQSAIADLLRIMARLRAPGGCPWDREQDHLSLRHHAIEEVYELIDAIEAQDDHEMAEELGDLLLQVVFHCQMAKERGAFDFEKVCRLLVDKLVRRHPHVFGNLKVADVNTVWANWEKIKHAEKQGTRRERPSALDGVPKHLPALLRAEKLVKKALKAGLLAHAVNKPNRPTRKTLRAKRGPAETKSRQRRVSKAGLAGQLFALTQEAQGYGWSAEELLSDEIKRRERQWRAMERMRLAKAIAAPNGKAQNPAGTPGKFRR